MNVGGNNLRTGLLLLLAAIIPSVAAQLILKEAMIEIGAFDTQGNIWEYAIKLIHPMVILGLGLFGTGTIFWIVCLSKLELSFAYPVATIQYFLIFLGAWFYFDERIPLIRLLGLFIIVFGVIIISFDKELK
ncbi:MAG: hypothetical protein IPJ74_20845 [Saprospiraceae bacterium]|nr:hypothetical protein [Saprospiraceae bacterium]